jgi:hypothetical protein
MKFNLFQLIKFRSKFLILGFILILTFVLTACGGQAAQDENQSTDNPVEDVSGAESEVTGGDAGAVDPASISFVNDVQPVFEQYCVRCHGDGRVDEGLNLLTYAGIMAGSDNGEVIVAGDPDNSLLAQMIVNGEMPKRGAKPNPQEIQVILDWIETGAKDN